MPEVINLLSSPVNSPLPTKKATLRRPRARSPTNDIFNVDSDDFKLSDSPKDIDPPSAQAEKKRRLSPSDSKPSKAKSSCKFGFLSSDDSEDVSSVKKTTTIKTSAMTTTSLIEELLSDPITFSSSAPEPRTIRGAAKSIIIDLEADEPGDEDAFSLSQPTVSTRTHLSERTANLLANITGPAQSSTRYKSFTQTVKSKTPIISTASIKTTKISTLEEDIFSSSPPKPRQKTSKPPAKDKDAREVERVATKAKKEGERAAEKERKRLAKEEKARERQRAADIAEVNKSKADKKNSTPEMMIDMARSLEGTSVGNEVLEYMKILGVETTFCDEELDLTVSTESANLKGNLVRWRRKIKARYNEEIGHWEPMPEERTEIEKHILVYMTAQEFLEVAALNLPPNQELAAQEKAMTRNLDAHVAALKTRYKDCKPIYLIEGLSAFLRKNKNAKNRAYAAAVRSQMPENTNGKNQSDLPPPPPPPPSSQPTRKRKKNPPTTPLLDLSHIDSPLTETLLLHLQLSHPHLLIHHTATPSLTSLWLKSFTEHISTIPYRHLRMRTNDAVGFCMDVGQVKTGDDRLDTYVKMLQEVNRVTPAMAWGIAGRFGGVGELVRAFRGEGGAAVLRDVEKGANRDGGVSGRVLGEKVSRRLCKVWLGRVEGSMDGIS